MKIENELRLIDMRELCRLLGTSKSSVERWLRSDPDFPQPRRLGPGSVRWRLDKVLAFIERLHCVAYDDHAFEPGAFEPGDAP